MMIGIFHTLLLKLLKKKLKKTTELNEVAIIRTKKAVEQKADRTILIFPSSLV
jgi:hypothetical protein